MSHHHNNYIQYAPKQHTFNPLVKQEKITPVVKQSEKVFGDKSLMLLTALSADVAITLVGSRAGYHSHLKQNLKFGADIQLYLFLVFYYVYD